jgi:hypothetical protein
MGRRDRQPRANQRVHARGERDAEVDLGKAEVAAIAAHHGEVVGQRQHRPCRERVALHRGDDRCGKREHAGQQRMHVTQIRFGIVRV